MHYVSVTDFCNEACKPLGTVKLTESPEKRAVTYTTEVRRPPRLSHSSCTMSLH